MPVPRQSSPGWYPDPAGTGPLPLPMPLPLPLPLLRYWDGRAWTDRRRPQPVLTTLELSGLADTAATQRRRAIEGPVRFAELPAPEPGPVPALAAEIKASAREASAAGPPAAGEKAAPPSTAERSQGPPPEVPPGRSGGGGPPDRRPRSGRKWWLLAAVAVLAAIAVGLAGQAMKPASPGPRVLTDGQFVRAAIADCARTMPTLRPPDGGPLGHALTPAESAGQIDAAATGLDQLAVRLGALPAADVDRAHIATWLEGWHGFTRVGHQYADHLRQFGASQKQPPAILQDGARLATTADNFARANGLKDCTFAVVPVMDPSTM